MAEDIMRDRDDASAETDEENDVETLEKELAEEKMRSEANLAGWQRTQADFENYKKIAEQEKAELRQFGNIGIMLNLLPVLDDIERAFDSLPEDLEGVAWIDGIKLIERKMKASLEIQGLSEIKAVGEPFDPRLHDAVRQDNGEEGKVIEEVQKGYKLHDRIIRPSKVVVGNGNDGVGEKEEQEAVD